MGQTELYVLRIGSGKTQTVTFRSEVINAQVSLKAFSGNNVSCEIVSVSGSNVEVKASSDTGSPVEVLIIAVIYN